MPSPRPAWAWLLEKEWRELWSARAWWTLLVLVGPIVGVFFIHAADTYAELSGGGGTSAGTGEAFSPLVGIWGPTFSAYELIAAFLLPFVGIRMVAGDRQSGALLLEQQQPIGPIGRLSAKSAVLFAGWLIASVPAAAAVALWIAYGGAVHGPELGAIFLGHLLNAALTIGLSTAVASVAEHPATAAIVVLAFTVGTWVLGFVAAVHGGLWERLAAYTPPVLVAEFQRGLVRLDLVLAALVLAFAGVFVAAVWLRTGVPEATRALQSAAVLALAALAVLASTAGRRSWDVTEARANSFSRADEAALARIDAPLSIEVHLAPEDPRRFDLERNALRKLRRALPDLRVTYVSASTTGLFEQAAADYGEIFYELSGRRTRSRGTSAEDVLDTIYSLSGTTPAAGDDTVFRGHPLARRPDGAGIFFYGAWPAVVATAAVFSHRRHT